MGTFNVARSAMVLAGFASLLAGCGNPRAASAPSTQPAPLSLLAPLSTVNPVATGYVMDAAMNPLAGARVEVVDGPQAGASVTTDANGQFPLTGPFLAGDRFRASRDGFVPATQGFTVSAPGGRPWLRFSLESLTAPVDLAGDYTLTLVADAACVDLPNEVRTRTFAATVKPKALPGGPSDTSLRLSVSGAPVLGSFDGFDVGVAGGSMGFWLDGGHDPTLVERLAPSTYLAYSGIAFASAESPVTTIEAFLDGWIDYCVMPSAMGAGYNCGTSNVTGAPIPGAAVTFVHCESPHHQLILTRR